MENTHLHDELSRNSDRITVNTAFGPVTGGRAANGAGAFLEIPYALPPRRFEDPESLPKDFRYEEKDYIQEATYGVQPTNDGQARDTPFEDKVGLGKPSENPLFLNIITPPSFPTKKGFPVKIYIHGGFLQFGSPHSLGSQPQYVAAERGEVWVNIGYRLSAFGFLASDKPKISGNYGFKDQWLALKWIKSNIEAFGGNPNDIQLSGLSAGAHALHQILHYASHLPDGEDAPFHSAVLQSNAILTDPKTPKELRLQFEALCHALRLDPYAPDILTTLKDPVKTPWSSITHVIETDTLGHYGTFRGCLSEDWLPVSPGLMEWQRSGGLAEGLKAHGVKSIAVGDLAEEWYLYSIAHPIKSPRDIVPNLERYFPVDVVTNLMRRYKNLPDDASSEESQRLFGDILSCVQVHLPVRLFIRDLQAANFPVLRYEVRWTPEQNRTEGIFPRIIFSLYSYVTHGSDRCLWAFRLPNLTKEQVEITKRWLNRFFEELKTLEKEGKSSSGLKTVLALREDRTIGWDLDEKWDRLMSLRDILPGEKIAFL
ncbi:carboxylesterase [Crucibulum laeve]|uniref:Carboxylic ester hydrolase n=1 Tax=Crucibulum laeve TaxID=68775 RepID=A0A5C3LMB9_9AGAR|nr:carboxylesterase [Crucibulum laeve]